MTFRFEQQVVDTGGGGSPRPEGVGSRGCALLGIGRWQPAAGLHWGVLVFVKFAHFSSELTKSWSSGARKY